MFIRHRLNCFPTYGDWKIIKTVHQPKQANIPILHWYPAKGKEIQHVAQLSKVSETVLIFPQKCLWEERRRRWVSNKNLPSDSHQWHHDSPQQSQGYKERGKEWIEAEVGSKWTCFHGDIPVAFCLSIWKEAAHFETSSKYNNCTQLNREDSLEGFHSWWHLGQILSTPIQLGMSAKLGQCCKNPKKTVTPTLFCQSSTMGSEQKRVYHRSYLLIIMTKI